MAISLDARDFDRLAGVVAALPDFQTVQSRADFVTDVFAGTPRRHDVVSSLNLDGTPRAVAVRVVDRLQTFGQDQPGRETLGVLVNKVLAYLGGGAAADYLRDLLERYPFSTKPTADRPAMGSWGGRESPDQVAEKIIGENTLRDIALLEIALEAARAVARIATPVSLGTGFLVARDLFMTNNHVIEDRPAAEQSEYQFDYQLDRHGAEVPVRTLRARAGGLFHTNVELDYTVLQLAAVPDDLPGLTVKAERARRDQRVNIIQHPGGHYKKISMQNNFVAYADARVIQYTTSTEPGSSGSPVFDNDFEVVGIHHGGGMLAEPDGHRKYLRNEGTSMIAVLADLATSAPEIADRLRR
jgi:V8-like Glu-specific endopeptidase